MSFFYKYVTIKLFKNRWLSQTSELCGTLKSSKIGLAFFTPFSLMGFKISPFSSKRSSKYPTYFEYEPAYVKQFNFSVSDKPDDKIKVKLLPAQLVQFYQNFVSHKLDNHLWVVKLVLYVQNLVIYQIFKTK